MEQQNQENYDANYLYDLRQVVMKRKILIMGLFLITVFLSVLYSFLSPNIYRGYSVFSIVKSDIVKSDIVKADEVVTSREIIEFLGRVDREKRVQILPKTYFYVTDVKITALKNSNDKVIVTIDCKKLNDILPAISEVQNYLNNIEIVKINTKQKKDILLQQSAELSELIKSSPDLLVSYYKLFKAGKLSTVGFNPIEVNKAIIDAKLELLSVEQQLIKLNSGGLEMAMQPYISSKPVSPKISRITTLAGIAGLLLGILLAYLMEYIGEMKTRRIKNDSMPIN